MRVVDLIDQKRQGQAHTQAEIDFLVSGVMAGTLPDYQLAAWLMAVCCQGLTLDETAWLTQAYVDSGERLDFSNLPGVVVDKHSTGGVGDKTTLVLAPMLAACGLKVAKLSGRGLGFTGGTVDKLEAISGFNVTLDTAALMHQVEAIGLALASQTTTLAPADGKTYALRDVTATVASIPLIAASVVSKKIAAGAQVITLDIKVGQGAFITTFPEAQQLAATCRAVGKRLGRALSTVISRMDQPLGQAVGHTIEVIETINTLQAHGPKDLLELCETLGAVTLLEVGQVDTLAAGKQQMRSVIASGAALEKFRAMIQAQGGDVHVVDQPERMPMPAQKLVVSAPNSGIVHRCDALSMAQAVQMLGGGRKAKGDKIDLAVGVWLFKKIGDRVEAGEPMAELWVNQVGIEEAVALVQGAYAISGVQIAPLDLIVAIESGDESAESLAGNTP